MELGMMVYSDSCRSVLLTLIEKKTEACTFSLNKGNRGMCVTAFPQLLHYFSQRLHLILHNAEVNEWRLRHCLQVSPPLSRLAPLNARNAHSNSKDSAQQMLGWEFPIKGNAKVICWMDLSSWESEANKITARTNIWPTPHIFPFILISTVIYFSQYSNDFLLIEANYPG